MELNRFTEKAQQALIQAQSLAGEYSHGQVEGEHLLLSVTDSLAVKMDSASFLLYRPSNALMDLKGEFSPRNNPLALSLEDLGSGRYILIFEWYSAGLRYETQQSLTVP